MDTTKTLGANGLRAVVVVATDKDGNTAKVVQAQFKFPNTSVAQLISNALGSLVDHFGIDKIDSHRVSFVPNPHR